MDKKQDLAFGIPNSELLPLESPWQFHEQKFGIGISKDRSLGPKVHFAIDPKHKIFLGIYDFITLALLANLSKRD